MTGKLGYLLNPTLKLYGLGGVAWVRDELRWVQTTGPAAGEAFTIGNQTRTGYDVGVGLSWMFARNWDVFVEYDHMGFGTKNLFLMGIGPSIGHFADVNVKQSVDKILVGIDYRFGDWGKSPVVAKY